MTIKITTLPQRHVHHYRQKQEVVEEFRVMLMRSNVCYYTNSYYEIEKRYKIRLLGWKSIMPLWEGKGYHLVIAV